MTPLTLCFDFANTVSWRTGEQPREKLTSYAGLLAWATRTGILPDRSMRQMLASAQRSPARAAAVLKRAVSVRESIYRTFAAIAAGRRVPMRDLMAVNHAIRESLSRLEVASRAGGFSWQWATHPDALDQILWPIARSAAELLTSSDLERVRLCAGPGCGWLFLDRSRNRSRKWCDMSDCGNRAKARRHYERARQAKS
jgi:predicted RNA-binding Zn ribbon-like protein